MYMRITIQYIPLNKIKPDASFAMTERIRKLRNVVRDCMHLLAVRKNRKDGSYILLSGFDHYEFLRQHSRKSHAPCIVEESEPNRYVPAWVRRLWDRSMTSKQLPKLKRGQVPLASWSILRTFMKREPRFKQLSYNQQLQVFMLALRYKKTVVSAMKAKVDDMLSK
jgi:hypothetical protein